MPPLDSLSMRAGPSRPFALTKLGLFYPEFPILGLCLAHRTSSACQSVLYLQRGRVKLIITSAARKEAVIAIMSEGEFFGEGCIAGQRLRTATAIAMEPTSVLEIGKGYCLEMICADFLAGAHLEGGIPTRCSSHLVDFIHCFRIRRKRSSCSKLGKCN